MLISRFSTRGSDRLDLVGLCAVPAAGIALDWLCRVHPGQLPFWAPWEFSWTACLGTGFALFWYASGLARTVPAARPHAWRRATFVAGVLLTYAVWQTRFQYMAEHMFFLNRVQHMVMHHLGPFLIALAWPGPTLWRGMPPVLRRMSALSLTDRIVSLIQQPVIAALLFDGLLFLWLYPPMHFIGMIDVRVYRIMNLSMIGDGLLFWFLILDPRRAPPARLSYAVRLVLVMAVQIPQIMLGALIAVVPRDLYPFYTLYGRLYPWMAAGIDQQLGGFVVYFPGAMMSAIAGLILFRWLWIADETDLPACTHASSVAGPARLPAG